MPGDRKFALDIVTKKQRTLYESKSNGSFVSGNAVKHQLIKMSYGNRA